MQTKIPIPRKGIYWGVNRGLSPVVKDGYEIVLDDFNMIEFETFHQAVISIFLYGFSYNQIIKIFSDFKDTQSLRNFIMPRGVNVATMIRNALQAHPPRQLVDYEYELIYEAVGKPEGKIQPPIYKKYMEWLNGNMEPFWMSSSKPERRVIDLEKRLEKKKLQFEKVKSEITKLEDEITEIRIGV